MLPIYEHRERIIQKVQSNQVTIVVGETGSGKTTQLPRYLYEAGLGEKGIIGITEPRRIAATSVAKFVAEQLGTQLGDVIGYQVRFDKHNQICSLDFSKACNRSGAIGVERYQAVF